MTATLFGRDIYLRHIAVDGKSYVQAHRVWDAERFVAAQVRAAFALNEKARADNPDSPARAAVEQLTEEQYRRLSK